MGLRWWNFLNCSNASITSIYLCLILDTQKPIDLKIFSDIDAVY